MRSLKLWPWPPLHWCAGQLQGLPFMAWDDFGFGSFSYLAL